MSACSVRSLAIEALYAVLARNRHADEALAERMPRLVKDADRRMLHALVHGVLRHWFSLEADVCRFLSCKPEIDVRCALLLGALQLRHLRTPAHAAVAETVSAIRMIRPRACSLVNAVLRRVADSPPPKRLKPHQRLELPKWMYRQWRDDWGAERLRTMAEHFGRVPPLGLAVRENRDAWLRRARAVGIEAGVEADLPHAVWVPASTPIHELPGFADGECWVMDFSAQAGVRLLVEALPVGTRRICDVCAAPGGKTALLRACLPGVKVISMDRDATRLQRLRQNLARMSWIGADVLQADACRMPWPDDSVEALFLDAPCSASGLLRRHPDVRFLHDQASLHRLAAIQRRMMDEAARVLRPGGRMVYAVCSIHRQEQQAALRDDLHLEAELRVFPDGLHDGFYAARLRKPETRR